MKTLITALILLTTTHAVQKELGEMFTKLQGDDKFTGKQTIAVMPFSKGEGVPADAGRTVSEFGVVSFHNSGRYTVVERQEFAKMLAEQELAQSDLVNEDTQLKMGKMLTASRLLVGSVTESFGQRMINARILNVENGEVIATSTTTLGPAAMDDFMKELLGEKGQVSATLIRSAVFPGWGQLYSNHPVRGGISMAATLGGAGIALYSWFATLDKNSNSTDVNRREDVYLHKEIPSPNGEMSQINIEALEVAAETGRNVTAVYQELLANSEERKKNARKEYTDAFDRTILIWAVTGGIYALNLVDATFAGMSAKKKFDLYFSHVPGNRTSVQLSFKF